MTRKAPPLPGLPPTEEAKESLFSETLWFKIGALEQEESDAPKPPPLPIDVRYSTSERLSLADRKQFSLHSHVPPAPTKARRATSFAEPYDDDDLAQYAVRWPDRVRARAGILGGAVAFLAVVATAAVAMTGGDSDADTEVAASAAPQPATPAIEQAAHEPAATTPEAAVAAAPNHAERREPTKRATTKRAKAKRAKARRAKARRAKAKRAKAKRAKRKRAKRKNRG